MKAQIIVNREPEKEIKPEKRKPSFNEKREFELLEKEIKQLTEEKASITEKLQDASLAYAAIEKLSNRFSEITTLMDDKELRWLELSEVMS